MTESRFKHERLECKASTFGIRPSSIGCDQHPSNINDEELGFFGVFEKEWDTWFCLNSW